jgi:hypothetical protein
MRISKAERGAVHTPAGDAAQQGDGSAADDRMRDSSDQTDVFRQDSINARR